MYKVSSLYQAMLGQGKLRISIELPKYNVSSLYQATYRDKVSHFSGIPYRAALLQGKLSTGLICSREQRDI